MAIMGVAADDPEETPRNVAYLALCAGYMQGTGNQWAAAYPSVTTMPPAPLAARS
jgi:hypothetical protein